MHWYQIEPSLGFWCKVCGGPSRQFEYSKGVVVGEWEGVRVKLPMGRGPAAFQAEATIWKWVGEAQVR
jgi:hypothetical protein